MHDHNVGLKTENIVRVNSAVKESLNKYRYISINNRSRKNLVLSRAKNEENEKIPGKHIDKLRLQPGPD